MPAIVQWKRLAALSFVLMLLSSAVLVLFSTGTAHAAKSERERKIAHALKIARNQKGDPYQYGADGPNRFDCSGLTQFAFGKAGLSLPRTSDDQSRYVRRLHDSSNIRAGDFMFFADGGDVYHMGIFTGRWEDRRRIILHASRSGTPVKVDPMWTYDWYAGTLRRR